MAHHAHRNVLIATLPAVPGSAVGFSCISYVNYFHPMRLNGAPDRLKCAAPGFIYVDCCLPSDRSESREYLENLLGNLAGSIYMSAAGLSTPLIGLLSTCSDTGDSRLTILAALGGAPDGLIDPVRKSRSQMARR